MATQSEAELRAHLDEQLGFLRASAKLFDEGDRPEAKRLATRIRLLLHDSGHSRSLLGLLGLKDRSFIDTATPRPDTVMKAAHRGLTGVAFGGVTTEHVPHLDRVEGVPVPFEKWWEAPVIIDRKQRVITRKGLVLAVANKDGGAHVDPELDDIYAEVTRGRTGGALRNRGAGWETVPSLAHASVRQIAHEVLVTLNPEYQVVSVPQPDHMVFGGFELQTEPREQTVEVEEVARNDPCPCGSGKKYKQCHGRPRSFPTTS